MQIAKLTKNCDKSRTEENKFTFGLPLYRWVHIENILSLNSFGKKNCILIVLGFHFLSYYGGNCAVDGNLDGRFKLSGVAQF